MISSSLFITGTDTSVGKTLVTALLALRLQARGVDVGVMKPYATGCIRRDDLLWSEDAGWLRAITRVGDDLDLINPVRFEEPLAPLVAARRAGTREDTLARCMEAYAELRRRHECVLVEGVGGLLVPLMEHAGAREGERWVTCVELANALGAPVVVVARRSLGTINHTLLTCRAPLHPPAHFAGLVFCDAEPLDDGDIAAQTSPALIGEMTGLPIWGSVPFLGDLSREALETVAETLAYN